MRNSAILPIVVAAFLAGCTVGPNYQRPAVPAPANFRAPEGTSTADPTSVGDLKWFEVFKDERLQELVRTALEQNYDLRDAVARVDASRAQLGMTRSDQLPGVAAGANISTVRLSRNGQTPLPVSFVRSQDRTFGGAALDLLSYEVDIWGKLRRATEAARANLLSAEENRKAVRTTLVSDVASAYFSLRELDYQLDISQRTLATRKDSLGLIQNRQTGGVATLLDLRQGEQLVYTASETIPTLQQQIEQTENQISLLLGKSPGDIQRGKSLTEQEMPPEVPAGLPSALLERRPDILAAEQNLIAANAEIGAARALYFPQLSLGAFVGGQSRYLTQLLSGPARVYSVAPSALESVFHAGQIRNQVRLSEAQERELLVTYQRAIYTALREVADAVVGFDKLRQQREQEEQLVNTLQGTLQLSQLRYRGGLDSYLQVLDAQRSLFSGQLVLAQLRLQERVSIVQLYRALGGGWQS